MNFSELIPLKFVESEFEAWTEDERSRFDAEYGLAVDEYRSRFRKGEADVVLLDAIDGARALKDNGRLFLVMEARLLPEDRRIPGEEFVVMKNGFSDLRFLARFQGNRFMDAYR